MNFALPTTIKVLLLANQADADIQYISHLGSGLLYHITDYMTKHERAEQDDL